MIKSNSFFNHRASRSAFYQLGGYALQGLNFIVNVKIANTLGVDTFALYSSILVWYAIITALTTFGMFEFVITLFTGDLDQDQKILKIAVFFHTIILLIIFLLIFMYQGYGYNSPEVKYLYILFPFILISGLSIIQTYHIFLLNGQIIAVTQLTTILICNLLKIITIYHSPELINFIFIFGLELIIVVAMSLWLSPHIYNSQPIKLEDFKRFWPVGLIYLLISAFSILGSKLDQIFATSLTNASTTASYFASLRLVELSLFIPIILNQAFLSVQDQKVRKSFFVYYFLSLTILCAVIFFFGDVIYYLFFSSQFEESYLTAFLPYLIVFWVGSYIRARALMKKDYFSILYCVITGLIAMLTMHYFMSVNPQTLPLLPAAYHAGFIVAMLVIAIKASRSV